MRIRPEFPIQIVILCLSLAYPSREEAPEAEGIFVRDGGRSVFVPLGGRIPVKFVQGGPQ